MLLSICINLDIFLECDIMNVKYQRGFFVMSVKMPNKPKFSKKFLIYLIVSMGILVLLLIKDGPIMIEYVIDSFVTLVLILDVLPLVVYLFFFIPQYRKYILAKTNHDKYVAEEEARLNRQYEKRLKENAEEKLRQERIENERQIAIASQQNNSPWAIKYCTYPCPHCGHYKVRYAKWEDKKASVAFWGIHSSKLGTNFKCENCGKMWE